MRAFSRFSEPASILWRTEMTTFLSDPARASGWRSGILRPSPTLVIAAAVLFGIDQLVYQRVGSAVVEQAPLDWTNHLLTTLFIVWATRWLIGERQIAAALVASVVIDVDHIPGRLGWNILTAGTSRPYSHSLTTVVVLLVIAAVHPRSRNWASGAALGVASHLWRDLAEPQGAGVALLWPVSDRTLTTPSRLYLASIAVLAMIAFMQAVLRRRVQQAAL
jgi:inner membrane protein